MTSEEFKRVVEEFLCEPWGDGSYPLKQIQRLWGKLESLSEGEFRSVMEIVTLKATRPPNLGEVYSAALPLLQRSLKRKMDKEVAELAQKKPCHYCDHSGVIFALLREDPTLEYSFGCPHCGAYQARGLKHPRVWDDSLKEKYMPISFKLDSLEAAEKIRREAFEKERATKKKIDAQLNATKKMVADMLKGQASKDEWKSLLNRVKGTKHV